MRRNFLKRGILYKITIVLFTWIFLTSTLTGLGSSSPVYYWPMDTDFGRSSGYPTIESNDCVQGKCMSFSGKECISVGPGFNTISPVQNKLTYSMWIKTGDNVNTLQYILTQNGANLTTGNEVTKRGIFIQNGRVNAFINPDYGSNQLIEGYSIVPNKWYFISLVQDISTVYLYIGGGGNIQQQISTSANNYGDSWDIGCQENPNNGFFKGKLDEINIFSDAFTQSQIFQEYSGYQDPSLLYTKNPVTSTTSSSGIFSFISLKSIIDLILVFLIITIPIYTVFSTRKVTIQSLKEKISLNNSHDSRRTTNNSRLRRNTSNTGEEGNGQGTQNQNNVKICAHCGSNLQPDERFCPNCGALVRNF